MVRRLLPLTVLCACTASNPDFSGGDGDLVDGMVELDLAGRDTGTDDPDAQLDTPDEDLKTPDGPLLDGSLPDPDAAGDGPVRDPDAGRDGPPPEPDGSLDGPWPDVGVDAELPPDAQETPDAAPDFGPDAERQDGCAPQVEACNGVDDDCDGWIDEGLLNACGVCGPDAEERCNGRDDDCDDEIDEDACAGCVAEVCNGQDDDCDERIDEGIAINRCGDCAPQPIEACNGEDDDCDGETDEGVLNACGECGDAPEEVCNGDDDDCDGASDEGVANACGLCGAVPAEECNREDDDCDGAADEGGVCVGCVDEACNGEDDDCDERIDEGLELNRCGDCGPAPAEVCNRQDDDCDGAIDEGVRNACGMCGDVPADVCNGRDDDCDGETDEGVTNRCGGCGAEPEEVCNDRDDDCDDRTDEGVANACGECGPLPLERCNARDDDCDGATDEGVANACGGCGPEPPEGCNGEDDDCDGEVDEGVANACGGCGPVPAEVCNGGDDDCDGETDEEVANKCGECGPEPEEVCNGEDDDCDRDIDEGVLNACGQCGAVPAEVCNGGDDDCDGTTDEGVLNACDACGAVPDEVCNREDDDCDGETDEGVLNACGECGDVPEERCNGRDDDCDGRTDEGIPGCVGDEVCNGDDDDEDGQTDEDLDVPCVVLLRFGPPGGNGHRLGERVLAYDDVTGDGEPEVVVRASTPEEGGEGDGYVVMVNGVDGEELWELEGDARLGEGMAVGDFDSNGSREVVVGQPGVENDAGNGFGRVWYIYANGQRFSLSAGPGRDIGTAIAAGDFGGIGGRDEIVLGDPEWDGDAGQNTGRVSVIELRQNSLAFLWDKVGDAQGRRIGRDVFAVDLAGDGSPEVAYTGLRAFVGGSQVIVHAINEDDPRITLNPLVRDRFQSYGRAMATGALGRERGARYFVGQPSQGAVGPNNGRGEAVYVSARGIPTDSQRGTRGFDEFGREVAVVPRHEPDTDLGIYARRHGNSVTIFDRGRNETNLLQVEDGVEFGTSVSVSRRLADGTYRLFVGDPGFDGSRGRVVVYSIR